MNVHVQRMVPSDRPAVLEMLADVSDVRFDIHYWFQRTHAGFDDYVAWVGDEPVGVLTGNFGSYDGTIQGYQVLGLPAGRYAFLSRVYVHESARESNVGTALVEFFALRAEQNGCQFVAGTLDDDPDSGRRQRFFEHLGFGVTNDGTFGAPTATVLDSIAQIPR